MQHEIDEMVSSRTSSSNTSSALTTSRAKVYPCNHKTNMRSHLYWFRCQVSQEFKNKTWTLEYQKYMRVLVTSTWSLGHLKPTGLPNTFLISRISAGAMLCPVPKFFQCFQPSNEAYWGKAGRSTELTKTLPKLWMAKGTKYTGKSWDGSRTNSIDIILSIQYIHNTLFYYVLFIYCKAHHRASPAWAPSNGRDATLQEITSVSTPIWCATCNLPGTSIYEVSQDAPPIDLYLVSFCPFMASMYTYIIHNPWRYVVWNLETWV